MPGEIKPGQAGTDAKDPGPFSVPQVDPEDHVKGTEAGPLLSRQGRGVKNGIPYGEQLQTEAREVRDMYPFNPGLVNRLRAATRKALGR